MAMKPPVDRAAVSASQLSITPRACTIARYGRHWAVRDSTGALVCLTVYKRGAKEVVQRLSALSELYVDQHREPTLRCVQLKGEWSKSRASF